MFKKTGFFSFSCSGEIRKTAHVRFSFWRNFFTQCVGENLEKHHLHRMLSVHRLKFSGIVHWCRDHPHIGFNDRFSRIPEDLRFLRRRRVFHYCPAFQLTRLDHRTPEDELEKWGTTFFADSGMTARSNASSPLLLHIIPASPVPPCHAGRWLPGRCV